MLIQATLQTPTLPKKTLNLTLKTWHLSMKTQTQTQTQTWANLLLAKKTPTLTWANLRL